MLKFYLNFIYKHEITCNQHNYKINNIFSTELNFYGYNLKWGISQIEHSRKLT